MRWIDDGLPSWQFDEVHHIRSTASPAALLDAVAAYDPAHDRWINLALALREAPGRLVSGLGLASALAGRARFGLADFVALGRQADAALVWALIRPVSGLIRRRILADISRVAQAAATPAPDV